MTGDDHGNGYTATRLNGYQNAGPAGCSVADWECVRSTSYLYPGAITDAQAAAFVANGFEISVHVNNGCSDWTPASLDTFYANDLNQFKNVFPSVPSPQTHRLHCVAWSDYDTQPKVESKYGIRLDTTYYYWPSTWILDRPGYFTGSGMPIRFTDRNGNLIDVYQATTQLTDHSGQTFPYHIDTLLNNALGPQGYYGVITVNFHTDRPAADVESDAVVTSARALGVPIVSAKQMLDWLDGRNGSSFKNISWNVNTLSFSVTVAAGANGLRALLPIKGATGNFSSMTYNGTPLSFSVETIKGVMYATFPALAGDYTGTYSSAP